MAKFIVNLGDQEDSNKSSKSYYKSDRVYALLVDTVEKWDNFGADLSLSFVRMMMEKEYPYLPIIASAVLTLSASFSKNIRKIGQHMDIETLSYVEQKLFNPIGLNLNIAFENLFVYINGQNNRQGIINEEQIAKSIKSIDKSIYGHVEAVLDTLGYLTEEEEISVIDIIKPLQPIFDVLAYALELCKNPEV